jgi:hypothetical protein
METESSLQNVAFWKINRTVFLDKGRMMDNVQKHNSCITDYVIVFICIETASLTTYAKKLFYHNCAQ